jgi:HEAT repeat protein
MYALGEIGDTRAVVPLADKLTSDDKEMRLSAASALGQIGDIKAVNPLIQALGDPDSTALQKLAGARDFEAL